MPETLLQFCGAVRCTAHGAPLGLSLCGPAGSPAAQYALTFSDSAPLDLPASLPEARVESLGADEYRIVSGARAWRVQARAVHVTRAVAAEFYRALPPRPVPLGKRLLWRAVLALAASRAGLALLRTLRR
jgi:hypothetical protein